jgi:hypothetical protein
MTSSLGVTCRACGHCHDNALASFENRSREWGEHGEVMEFRAGSEGRPAVHIDEVLNHLRAEYMEMPGLRLESRTGATSVRY